jgi:hypothetical protein
MCYKNNKLRGLGPQANYTDQVTAACRRSARYNQKKVDTT